MGKTVRLTDATLLSLARNEQIRQAIPAFKKLRRASGHRGCGKCGKRAPRQQTTLLQLKAALAKSPAAIKQLKKILKVDTLVVYTVEGKQTIRKEL